MDIWDPVWEPARSHSWHKQRGQIVSLALGTVTIENGLVVRRGPMGPAWVKATCVHCKKKWWRDKSTDRGQVCGPCVGKLWDDVQRQRRTECSLAFLMGSRCDAAQCHVSRLPPDALRQIVELVVAAEETRHDEETMSHLRHLMASSHDWSQTQCDMDKLMG